MKIRIEVDSDLKEYIPSFIENRKKDIASIESCMKAGDFASIEVIGHKIKGSSGGYGFHGLGEIGAALENAARQQLNDKILECSKQMVNYLAEVDITYV